MRSLIWKELRENIKWAALSMVLLGFACLQGLNTTRYGMPDYYYYDGITLCNKTFLLVTTFGFAAAGIMLGLVQILPELKRDRWAALLHRPASRESILGGKLIAGLLLYGIAAGLPFLFSVWMVATPGNYASPFLPAMVLPGLADLTAGALYYLAAVTLGLQRGGWIGLRLLPLFAAIHVSFFLQNSKFFYVALEAVLLLALALLVACWGAMRSPERFGTRPLLARIGFLAVIFYGICGLGDLGRALLDALIPPSSPPWQTYEIAKDGTPLVFTYKDSSLVAVSDLQGNPVTDPKLRPDRARNATIYPSTISSYIGDAHGWKPRPYQYSYRDSSRYLFAGQPYRYPRFEQWFQINSPRSLVGYDLSNKKAIERFDARGFQPPGSVPRPIPESEEVETVQSGLSLLVSPHSLRLAFLNRREIKELPLPFPAPIFGGSDISIRTSDNRQTFLAAAFSSHIVLYDTDGNLLHSLPYGKDVSRWGQISVAIPEKDAFVIKYSPSSWIKEPERRLMPSYVDIVTASGEVQASFTLPPLPRPPRNPRLSSLLQQDLRAPAYFFGTMAYQKVGALLGSTRLQEALIRQFGPDLARTRSIAIWTVSISLALAIIAFALARRAQMPLRRALAWAGFAAALNLAGFLTFLLVADWPALVSCASCRGRRRVEEETCPHCHAGWPSREFLGIEILDQAAITTPPATRPAP